jgi:hypothetical protein
MVIDRLPNGRVLNNLRRTSLTRLAALEVLRRKDEKAYRLIVGTNILEWDQKDYTKYDKELIRNKKIQEVLSNKCKELMGSVVFVNGFSLAKTLNFIYFPVLRLDYKKKGGMICLDWMSELHFVADVGVLRGEILYFGRYFSPKEADLEPIFLFRTPTRLLKCLTEGKMESQGVEIVVHYLNTSSYKVLGFPDKIELPDSFINWIMEFSNRKGLNDFLDKMLNLGVMDQLTYDIVTKKIKSESEPVIEYSELNDIDIERLRKIGKIKDPHFNSWWGKKVLGLTSRQGPSDFLDKMKKGGYVNLYKSDLGVRVELTEKGRRAIQ